MSAITTGKKMKKDVESMEKVTVTLAEITRFKWATTPTLDRLLLLNETLFVILLSSMYKTGCKTCKHTTVDRDEKKVVNAAKIMQDPSVYTLENLKNISR